MRMDRGRYSFPSCPGMASVTVSWSKGSCAETVTDPEPSFLCELIVAGGAERAPGRSETACEPTGVRHIFSEENRARPPRVTRQRSKPSLLVPPRSIQLAADIQYHH